MNYKIVYEKWNGKRTEVVVYSQPWTNTTKILSYKKLSCGGRRHDQ